MSGTTHLDAAGTRLDEATMREYLATGAWRDRPLSSYLRDAIAAVPHRTAAVTRRGQDRTALTYRELGSLVDRVRTGLRRLGVGPGDVVSVMLPNTHEFAAVIWAIFELGAVYSGVPTAYARREVAFMLNRAKSKVWIVPSEYRGRDYVAFAKEIRDEASTLETVVVLNLGEGSGSPERHGDFGGGEGLIGFDELIAGTPEPAPAPPPAAGLTHLGFTSGTTGEPKAVMNTHQTLDAVLVPWVKHVGRDTYGEPPVNLVPSPIGHHTGFLWGVLLSAYLHGTAVYWDRWNPDAAPGVIRDEGVTMMVAAPTFLQDLVRMVGDDPSPVASLRMMAIPGAPIPRSLVPVARERLGCFICPAWGMTEWGIGVSAAPGLPFDRIDATDGAPVPGCRVRVIDPSTRVELPPGREGALEITGPGLFLGYYDRPDATAEAIRDGWFATGDLAVLSEDGQVTLAGRTKDIVIRGGENIPVTQVEDLLYRHPDVLDAAVVGVPDPRLGERACAVLAVRPGSMLTLADVTRFLLGEGLSKHFLPERLELVEALPKTMSGKIRKVELRDRLSG